MQGTSNTCIGTRTVPVPGNGGPNVQGTRTRTVPVPGSGEPNIPARCWNRMVPVPKCNEE